MTKLLSFLFAIFRMATSIDRRRDVPRKYTNDVPADRRDLFVEQARCNAFNRVPQGEKLSRPGIAFGAFHAGEIVQGDIADLALHDLAVVEHCELENEPLRIMPNDLVTGERHGAQSPAARSAASTKMYLGFRGIKQSLFAGMRGRLAVVSQEVVHLV
jgi:hypothetical protein